MYATLRKIQQKARREKGEKNSEKILKSRRWREIGVVGRGRAHEKVRKSDMNNNNERLVVMVMKAGNVWLQ